MDKEEGYIGIRMTESIDYVTIYIKDNGVGIEEKALPHIFERFYRADHSRNSKTGGSGLGLSIAHQIITQHGGDIWVESKKVKERRWHLHYKNQLEKGEHLEKNFNY